MKYTTTQITFREVPDEISLCINISNCPIHCPDCHSKELWEDIGIDLTPEELQRLIQENNGISCVCFMGGDNELNQAQELGNFIKQEFPQLKTAWYSGRKNLDVFFVDCITNNIPIQKFVDGFDYIKVGPYRKEYGGLDNPNTNQKLYQKIVPHFALDFKDYFMDITYKFWKNDSNNCS